MRFIAPACLAVLFFLLPVGATPPEKSVVAGYRLTDEEVMSAAAVVDTAWEELWHSQYQAWAATRKRYAKPNEVIPLQESLPGVASDEVFLRRATLDATGVIPTAAEARAFLDDPAADKRHRLVDRLLLSAGAGRKQFYQYADLLRLRDEIGAVSQEGYITMVRTAAELNLPFDHLVRTLLVASGDVADNPATGFLLRDQGNLLLTLSEFSRTFLGEDIHCAACHDHPFSDRTQMEFYQFAACFGATEIVLKPAVGAEKEVWPARAFRTANGGHPSRAGLLTIRDTATMGMRLPTVWRYRDGLPDELVTKAVPLNFDWKTKKPVTWSDPDDLRPRFAEEVTRSDRFAEVTALSQWLSLFGTPEQSSERRALRAGFLVPPPADVEEAGSLPNVTAVACDETMWPAGFDFYRSGGMSPQETKFLAVLSGLMRQVHFDLREFRRVLMSTHAYSRTAAEDIQLGVSRASLPPAPLLRRLAPEMVWDAMIQLGGADERQWRYASDLPQTLPDSHALRTSGRGERLQSNDSSRFVTHDLVRLMMNGEAVRRVVKSDSAVVASVMTEGKDAHAKQIEGMFLSVLGRRPTEKELSHANEVLAAKGAEGMGNLVWSLLNTSEFLFEQ